MSFDLMILFLEVFLESNTMMMYIPHFANDHTIPVATSGESLMTHFWTLRFKSSFNEYIIGTFYFNTEYLWNANTCSFFFSTRHHTTLSVYILPIFPKRILPKFCYYFLFLMRKLRLEEAKGLANYWQTRFKFMPVLILNLSPPSLSLN